MEPITIRVYKCASCGCYSNMGEHLSDGNFICSDCSDQMTAVLSDAEEEAMATYDDLSDPFGDGSNIFED